MAVETAPPVRSEVQKPQAHAHAHHGAKRPGAADDANAAATGFSALLGAAGQADAAAPDAATDTSALVPGNGRKTGKALVGGVDDAATLAAAAGLLKPTVALPTTQLAGAAATAVAASAAAPGAVTAAAAAARGAFGGKALQGAAAGASGVGQPLPKLVPPGGKPDAPTALPVPDSTALQATAGTATPTAAHPGGMHGLAATAPGQQAPAGALTGAQQLRANDVAAQSASNGVQAAAAAGADSSALQGVAVSTSGVAGGEGDGRSSRGGASTVSLGDGGGRWAGMLSDIGRAPPSETGAGAFTGGGQSRGQGAEGERRGGDGLASSAVGFAPTASANGTEAGSPGSGTDAQQAVAGASVMTPDEWLAATTPAVNSHGVQKAELTLDAFGAPVDVQISLSGNDAQVSFQSDQADTRAALVGAVSDLQNLLQQEGLVLSGVTVGGSGAQGNGAAMADGGGRGDTRRAARPDSAPVQALAAAPARPRPTSAGSGALDVFA